MMSCSTLSLCNFVSLSREVKTVRISSTHLILIVRRILLFVCAIMREKVGSQFCFSKYTAVMLAMKTLPGLPCGMPKSCFKNRCDPNLITAFWISVLTKIRIEEKCTEYHPRIYQQRTLHPPKTRAWQAPRARLCG